MMQGCVCVGDAQPGTAPAATDSELALFGGDANRCSFDPLDRAAWLQHLGDEGFVVLRGAVPAAAVDRARDLHWDWLESLGSGILRDDPRTWHDRAWPGMATAGFMQSHGGGHSAAMWHVREQPAVHAAFAAIWNTEDLIVSFDTALAWRPWWLHDAAAPGAEMGGQDQAGQGEWRPRVERLHCDQNPLHKPGRACVQGMVPLISVSPLVGGLQVVPRSHTAAVQQQLIAAYPEAVADAGEDWVELAPDDLC